MTYRGQSRFERFLEFVGLIHTGVWVRICYQEDGRAVEDHNRMVQDDG